MQYLKTWMGVTVSTGVGMGDDGGYPERKFSLIENLDQLVRTYDPQADYYKLLPVDVKPIVTAANDLR